jgi:dipeptidyl aminopeptidase/acylaminoacyl peptidase
VALALAALASGPAGAHTASSCPSDPRLGRVAYLRGGALHVLDLRDCHDRIVVAHGASGPVRFGADGRPVTEARRAEPPVVSPSGRWTAVVRTHLRHEPGVRRKVAFGDELWLEPVGGGAARLLYRVPHGRLASIVLAGFAPDGSVLFQLDPWNSSSMMADGLPLERVASGESVRRVLPAALLYTDWRAVCGAELLLVSGFDRYATKGKSIVELRPGSWRPRLLAGGHGLSWVSPACSADGHTVVAAAGPNGYERLFGQERRSIRLLDGRRLASPPRGATDESPRLSRDGRYLLFVRSGPTTPNAQSSGALYLERLSDRKLFGPLARLGPTDNYYGHYDWPSDLDWFQSG